MKLEVTLGAIGTARGEVTLPGMWGTHNSFRKRTQEDLLECDRTCSALLSRKGGLLPQPVILRNENSSAIGQHPANRTCQTKSALIALQGHLHLGRAGGTVTMLHDLSAARTSAVASPLLPVLH
jgi:hypothetical protein